MIGNRYFDHQLSNEQIPVQLHFNRKYGRKSIFQYHFVSFSPNYYDYIYHFVKKPFYLTFLFQLYTLIHVYMYKDYVTLFLRPEPPPPIFFPFFAVITPLWLQKAHCWEQKSLIPAHTKIKLHNLYFISFTFLYTNIFIDDEYS